MRGLSFKSYSDSSYVGFIEDYIWQNQWNDFF